VLRPLEKGYQLIGESYVDGIMYGELAKEAGRSGSGVSIEDIDIF
jgi:hypothetical protein